MPEFNSTRRVKTQEQMDRNRARRSARKLEAIRGGQNFPVKTAGRSLAKVMQDELDQAMAAWIMLRKNDVDKKEISKARGVVRGYALSLAIILRPYDDRVSTAKLIEKASMERIRNDHVH